MLFISANDFLVGVAALMLANVSALSTAVGLRLVFSPGLLAEEPDGATYCLFALTLCSAAFVLVSWPLVISG